MSPLSLQIQMFGDFSIRSGSSEISDSGNRSRKVWLLLAYMIYNRSNPNVSSDKFINLLWGDDESSSNPNNALKTMFHRARTCLNQLGDDAGHTFIISSGGTYVWNNSVPVTLDIDVFDALCKAGAEARTDDKRIDNYLHALDLYRGDFLSKMSSEMWVVPIATYYHNLYIKTVMETLPLLEKHRRYEDAVKLCNEALVHEPYEDEIYAHLMSALIQLGNKQAAAKVYEDMSQLLLSSFGIMPSEKCLALYRQAIHTVNDRQVSSGIIMEQLREAESDIGGALLCDYDVFKNIYHSLARSVARSGYAAHLALISITGENSAELPKRSLNRVIDNLKILICNNLRRGDIVSRCSVSQFILLLPQANYENSCMVCDRIVRSFSRQYPHSPASLSVSVHPLEPNL